jgi:hypothetical protein
MSVTAVLWVFFLGKIVSFLLILLIMARIEERRTTCDTRTRS